MRIFAEIRRAVLSPRGLTVLMLLLWIGMSPPAAAESVERLYEVEVAVSDRSSEARLRALRSAMSQLLVRLTGERDAVRLVGVESLMSQPGRYVQQFLYLTEKQQRATGETSTLKLQVRFDGKAVERVLREYGLPLWGGERPVTLLWLAVEGDGRSLIGESVNHPLQAVAREVARARGLPILFPLLDLEDNARVGFADVWGGFDDTVLAASERYQAQAVLIGRLQQGAAGWQGRWTLHFGDDSLEWTTRDANAGAVLREGLHETADRLALRLAVRSLGAGGTAQRIRVKGVSTPGDYARVLRYFEQLTTVRDVEVVAATPQALDLVLSLESDREALSQSVRVGRLLEEISTTPEPVYRLRDR